MTTLRGALTPPLTVGSKTSKQAFHHHRVIMSSYCRHIVVILSCRHIIMSSYHYYIPLYDFSKSPARVKYIQSYPGHVIITLLLCYTLSKQFLPSSTITVHKWSGGKLPVMSCHNVVTLLHCYTATLLHCLVIMLLHCVKTLFSVSSYHILHLK